MKHTGPRFGIITWRYNPATDENEWDVLIGFGKFVIWPSRYYTKWAKISWFPISTCFEWWAEHLGVERGRVITQYRIHSFRRWPIRIEYGSNE